jgi:hypothetical protein
MFYFRPKVSAGKLIKTHSLSMLYETTHADVYKGSGLVLKKYRGERSRSVYTNERTHMEIIDPRMASTPELIEFNDKEMFLLMKDVGTDGIDLINSYEMGRDTWTLFYKQVYKALNGLHSLGFVHRDIKPENTAFKNGKWHIIDLAFAESQKTPLDNKVKGTFPYCAPMMGNEQLLGVFLDNNAKTTVKVANDYFAFALSVLTTGTDLEESRTLAHVSLDMGAVQRLATGSDEVVTTCAMIVLSCVDIRYQTMVWAGGRCTFRNLITDTILTEKMVERDISVSWAHLGSIIEKQIGCVNNGTCDVQAENKHEEGV